MKLLRVDAAEKYRVPKENPYFNKVPVFDHQPNPINVAALDSCKLWVIDPDGIRKCIAQYPETVQSVISNLCQNLRMLLGSVEELSFYQVMTRLARLIGEFPRRTAAWGAGTTPHPGRPRSQIGHCARGGGTLT